MRGLGFFKLKFSGGPHCRVKVFGPRTSYGKPRCSAEKWGNSGSAMRRYTGKYPNHGTSLCVNWQERKREWNNGWCHECKHSSCQKTGTLWAETAVQISAYNLHDLQYDTVLRTEHYVSSGLSHLYQLTQIPNPCFASGGFASVSRIQLS
jgi:hypothetical protein